jgi:hypothetical protein
MSYVLLHFFLYYSACTARVSLQKRKHNNWHISCIDNFCFFRFFQHREAVVYFMFLLELSSVVIRHDSPYNVVIFGSIQKYLHSVYGLPYSLLLDEHQQ